MSFATKLRELRKAAGMTQAELAKIIKLQKSTISMYENGKREPEYEILEAIADTFNVDMNTLLDSPRPSLRRLAIFAGVGGLKQLQFEPKIDDIQAPELRGPTEEQLEQMRRNAIARAFMKMILPNNPELQAFIDKATITVDGEITLPDAAQLDQMYLNKMLGMFAQAVKDAKPNGDGTFDIAFNTGIPAKK